MVQLQGITFGYRRRERLFDGLGLTLAPGNIYGLLGRNGAGKTTLLRLMSGLPCPMARRRLLAFAVASQCRLRPRRR